MTTVGVRELKAHLSEYLARAKAGEVIVVTDRGKELAQLAPVPATAKARMEAMVAAGLAYWGGGRLAKFEPLEGLKPGQSISDLVIQEREEAAARLDPKPR